MEPQPHLGRAYEYDVGYSVQADENSMVMSAHDRA